jgi:quercetin dioxygenase-like cupin family protein
MMRTLFLLTSAAVLVACGMALAAQHQDGVAVKVLHTQDIKEMLDGKETAMSVVEVTVGPGEVELAHRHPGPGFVYVLEGEYELGIDNQPTKRLKAGEVFYEPAGALHRVGKNPSKAGRTRLIAVVLHPRDAKQIAVPEK